jgi:hypothetical protein
MVRISESKNVTDPENWYDGMNKTIQHRTVGKNLGSNEISFLSSKSYNISEEFRT